jgi:hypothetical protein
MKWSTARNAANEMVDSEERRHEQGTMAPAPTGIPSRFSQLRFICVGSLPSNARSMEDRSVADSTEYANGKSSASFMDGRDDKENSSGQKEAASLVNDSVREHHRVKFDRSQRGACAAMILPTGYSKVETAAAVSMDLAAKTRNTATTPSLTLERSHERPTVASVPETTLSSIVIPNTASLRVAEMALVGTRELSGTPWEVHFSGTESQIASLQPKLRAMEALKDERKYSASVNNNKAGVDEESRAGEEKANEESSIGSTKEADEESTTDYLECRLSCIREKLQQQTPSTRAGTSNSPRNGLVRKPRLLPSIVLTLSTTWYTVQGPDEKTACRHRHSGTIIAAICASEVLRFHSLTTPHALLQAIIEPKWDIDHANILFAVAAAVKSQGSRQNHDGGTMGGGLFA